MKYKILITDGARADTKEIREYYKSVIPGLEKRFSADLKKSVVKIPSNPLTFGYRFKSFRSAQLNVFPFQVHYIF